MFFKRCHQTAVGFAGSNTDNTAGLVQLDNHLADTGIERLVQALVPALAGKRFLVVPGQPLDHHSSLVAGDTGNGLHQRQTDNPSHRLGIRHGQFLGLKRRMHGGDNRELAVNQRTITIKQDQNRAGNLEHVGNRLSGSGKYTPGMNSPYVPVPKAGICVHHRKTMSFPKGRKDRWDALCFKSIPSYAGQSLRGWRGG